MSATKEDAQLLLRLDEVHRPGTAARKFSYSDELAKVVEDGTFFDTYTLDSDERFFINQIAIYHDTLGMFVSMGIVDEELALKWSGAKFAWKLIGPILIQASEVFGSEDLWADFEALAAAHAETSN